MSPHLKRELLTLLSHPSQVTALLSKFTQLSLVFEASGCKSLISMATPPLFLVLITVLQLDFLALWLERSGQLEETCSIIFCFLLCINFPPVKPKIPPPSAAAIPATLKPARRPMGPPTTPPMTAPATGRAASLYFAACKVKKKRKKTKS